MRLTASDWDLLEELLPEARGLAPGQRAAFLARRCPDNPGLRAEIEAMLDADRTGGLLDSPVALSAPPQPENPGLPAGTALGDWRTRQRIGRGGMGEVYAAERADGRYAGLAAIKLLHGHLASEALRRRFAREGQILGRLSHPHIARLLDAGAAEDGRPFLVLEYVDGQRLDHYCDAHSLGIDARITLFLQVCEAVAQAHAQLIVHRDLKPSNIFVDADGQVKLLDFGIAKLVEDEQDTAATELTRLGGRPLTPAYAAPEQIRGEAVTTATDIYSLGVLLHELLCGTSPYGPEATTSGRIERAVLDGELVPPSHATGPPALARARRATPESLRRDLVGDLDTIVGKALSRPPELRYASVAALADDLRRYLDDQPISARAPSLAYRAGKFVRRHALGVAAGAAVVVAVVAGVAGTLWQAQRAEEQARRAQAHAERAERVKDFVLSVFREQSPWLRGSSQPRTPRELLADAARRLDDELASEPALHAELLGELGSIQIDVGDLKSAEALLQRAVEAHTTLWGADSLPVAQALAGLARIHLLAGRSDEAETLARRALGIQDARGADPLTAAETRTVLANAISFGKGTRPEAEALYREALGVQEAHLGSAAPATINTLFFLAQMYNQSRRLEEAEAAVRDLVARCERGYGESSAALARALNLLGDVLAASNRPEEAVALFERGTAMLRAHAGERNNALANALSHMAIQLRELGRYEQALAVYGEAERALPDGNLANRADILRGRGRVALRLNRADEAERDLSEAYALIRSTRGEDNGFTWYFASEWGRGLAAQGRFAEAEAIQRQALQRLGEIMGPRAYQNALLQSALAETLQRQPQRLEDAVDLRRQALDVVAHNLGREHLNWAGYAEALAGALDQLTTSQAAEEALALREQSLRVHVRSLGEDHPQTRQAVEALAASLRSGRQENATRALEPRLAPGH